MTGDSPPSMGGLLILTATADVVPGDPPPAPEPDDDEEEGQ